MRPLGTTFQRKAWDALCRIPFGQTRNYGAQAKSIGQTKAVRAVGRANGANPISIIVPCHRVVGADGTMTGFGGGVETKRWLLALERTGEVPTWSPREREEARATQTQLGLFG
ncbi:MAG: methylated-DNA--[protein]-cysteine S-methyltransferase [Myxococcota bacterium]